MTAYYNEHDPFAAAWLRELIAEDLIAPGEVDERDIQDVTPDELRPFRQCHFFAGIGIWSLALRQAGWGDEEPIWTGSCPCQPFSAAGKGDGFADERHLWPAFHWLIDQSNPQLVLGEQVASSDGLAWLDLVSADMEAAGFAFGAIDTCAAGFGAPHIRQRLYWMAYPDDARLEGRLGKSERAGQRVAGSNGVGGGMADADGRDASAEGLQRCGQQRQQPQDGGVGWLGNADREHERRGSGEEGCQARQDEGEMEGPVGERLRLLDGGAGQDVRPGPLNGLWRTADWLHCTDLVWRPVAPGTFPLAPAGSVRNRMGTLRGAGNAINLAQAQGFIEAVMAVRAQAERLAA